MGKICTKRGDTGMTDLANRERVSKTDERIEVNGEIDELMALLGMVKARMDTDDANREEITLIQLSLMTVMSYVAMYKAVDLSAMILQTARLERMIDEGSRDINPRFVLPGSSMVEATLHAARAKARTVERRMWQLNAVCPQEETVMRYINRLSDYLFVLASRY